jgi:hypothetical protein
MPFSQVLHVFDTPIKNISMFRGLSKASLVFVEDLERPNSLDTTRRTVEGKGYRRELVRAA